jgi:hypothetical protein
MKNKALPDRQGRKERATALKRTVCELLNWTEMQYAEYVYNTGLEYLKEYLRGDMHAIGILERSPIFWAWWKNHFTNRDEKFVMLNRTTPIRSQEIRIQLYHHYNEAAMLADSIHPNSVVLNESYALMITEVVNHETRQHEKAT